MAALAALLLPPGAQAQTTRGSLAMNGGGEQRAVGTTLAGGPDDRAAGFLGNRTMPPVFFFSAGMGPSAATGDSFTGAVEFDDVTARPAPAFAGHGNGSVAAGTPPRQLVNDVQPEFAVSEPTTAALLALGAIGASVHVRYRRYDA